MRAMPDRTWRFQALAGRSLATPFAERGALVGPTLQSLTGRQLPGYVLAPALHNVSIAVAIPHGWAAPWLPLVYIAENRVMIRCNPSRAGCSLATGEALTSKTGEIPLQSLTGFLPPGYSKKLALFGCVCYNVAIPHRRVVPWLRYHHRAATHEHQGLQSLTGG